MAAPSAPPTIQPVVTDVSANHITANEIPPAQNTCDASRTINTFDGWMKGVADESGETRRLGRPLHGGGIGKLPFSLVVT